MLTKKTLLIGLVLALLAIPGFVAGGTEATGSADVTIDVGSLSGECTYWAPAPPWEASSLDGIEEEPARERDDVMGGPMSRLREHTGAWAEVAVADPNVVSGHFACTDVQGSDGLLCTTLDCFLRGEHYIMLRMADQTAPFGGCIRYNIKGIRRAAVASTIDGEPQPFFYLRAENDAVEKVCGLEENQTLKLRLMACPDLDRNREIDLFRDFFSTVFSLLLSKGDPGWNYRADHNENGVVDFFGDIFAVGFRIGLRCDDFDY